MDEIKKWRVPVLIVFLILGFLISVQFRAQQVYLSDLSLQSTDDLVLILKGLNDKKSNLEKDVQVLQQQQQAISSDTTNGASLENSLAQESTQLKLAIGLTPVKGPGITVTIPPNSSIVYLDLVDIINELWASQAEAISINNQRITPWTTIFWNKEKMTMSINGSDVTFPCTINAIGNPDTMEAGLELLGGELDNLAVYKIYPTVTESTELDLPGAAAPTFHYLQVIPTS